MKSPLPENHFLTKETEVVKRSKKEGDCIRYFLTPEELKKIHETYEGM